MQTLRNLKLGARLGLAFAVVLLLTVVVGVGSILQLGRIQGNVRDLATNWLAATRYLGEVNDDLAAVKRSESRHLLAIKAEDHATQERDIETRKKHLDESVARYASTVTTDEEKVILADLRSALAAYFETIPKLLALSRDQARLDEAKAQFNGISRSTFNAALAVTDKAIKFQEQGATRAYEDATRMYENTRLAVIVLLVAAVAIGAGLAYAATRSITRPIAEAVTAAERVAQGDLSADIRATSTDEVGALLTALRNMNDSLVGIVSQVRNSSDSIATGSAQIASGNADLSQRTEEQASNLEETAASMEQLTATVKQNSDTARQATQLATSACAVAEQGGQAVTQVIHTMEQISASSKKIADIIGVIDGIAFQTNILALNAAVEAARAGEQGRGFAVVAGEVRSLASRSAEAAKEIKALIGESVQTVESGSATVAGAGNTMTQIVTQVRRVSDLMGEISAASGEQSQGISQVGEAVTQLDQVTQQNAALVEESAAAADSLKHQAARLAEVVSVFKLPSGAQPAFTAAPSPPRSATLAAPPRPAGRPVARAPAIARTPAASKSAAAPTASSAPATRGDDDDWTSF
jgi:methyl-accepting chemotaxis protein